MNKAITEKNSSIITLSEPKPKAELLGLDDIKTSLRAKIKHYKRRAQEIEEYLSKNPQEWGKFQSEFNTEVNNIFREIMDFEKVDFSKRNKEKVDRLKRLFINRVRNIFLEGAYNHWSLSKPFGYSGDFKIIDDIYQNNPLTTGFERLFDNYFQMSAISIAVRNRKEDFKRMILNFANERKDRTIRVMNIASGSCREVKEILTSGELLNRDVIFDCYENEKAAIEFAKKLLAEFSNVNFVKENVLKISLAKDIRTKIKERYDFIYATGFFDYLNYKVAVRLLKNLKVLLNNDGIIAISNVRDKYSNPSVHYMEWVGDWNLVYRNEEEFKKIFSDAEFKENQLKIQYEQQGIMQYIFVGNKI